MKILKLLIALVPFMTLYTSAQGYKLGEVTKEELQQKMNPADTSAAATIIFSKGMTSMSYSERGGFDLVTEVEMKIKIHSKEGYQWANKSIPFYNSSGTRETVDVSKAFTYNLVDGSIKKTKLKSEGEFTEEINKSWKLKKIVMPDVKEGSIVEYKYTITSPFISVFPEWRFQESIPVNHSEFVTKIPEYFKYSQNFRGYYTPKQAKSSANKTYTYTTKERTGDRIVKTTFNDNKIEYSEAVTTYALDNLPAMKNEQYVDNIGNYTASIEHELASLMYPNKPAEYFSTTWEDVVKTIYNHEDFGGELKKTGYFEKDITALITGLTDEQKANTIFSYVKNSVNWNGYTGFSCDKGVKRAYTDKVGNIAEINLMLTAMLRYAGLNANPVLVSTRANKIALFPNRTAFNYVITSVEVGGKTLLMDATDKAALPNILPVRAINWVGRLVRNDGSSVPVDLVPKTSSKEIINIFAQVDNNGNVTGKVRNQYFDYNAFAFRSQFGDMSKDSYMETLEKRYNGIEITDYNKDEGKDLLKPVVNDYAFTHKALSDIIGDKIYLNPLLFLTQSENPFKQEARLYPIDFVYPHQDKYMINITIPEGYTIESMPKQVSLVMEDGLGSFKYNISSANNQIQLNVLMDINSGTVSQDYYQTLKDFFQKMIEKQNEKIILKKA